MIDTFKKIFVSKRSIAYLLIFLAMMTICFKGTSLKHAYLHPEMFYYRIFFVANDGLTQMENNWHLSELKKVFLWEWKYDGCQNRILTGALELVNLKFRGLLFRFIPPSPAVGLTWLFSVFLTPLLLYNFIRRYCKLNQLLAALITVIFIFSPATIGNTFQSFLPSKVLATFFYILMLNMLLFIRQAQVQAPRLWWGVIAFSVLFLYGAFFSDPYCYGIVFTLPVFFFDLFCPRQICARLLRVESFDGGFKIVCKKIGLFFKQDVMAEHPWRQFSGLIVYSLCLFFFIISIKFLIPQIASASGYFYEFMHHYKNQIKTHEGLSPFEHLMSLKYYGAVMINMYWALVACLGLRGLVPLSWASLNNLDSTHWVDVLTKGNIALVFCLHILLLGVVWFVMRCILRKRELLGNEKKVLIVSIIGMYVVAGWITLIHGNISYMIPYSTYIYGSPLAIMIMIALASFLSVMVNKKQNNYIILLLLCIIAAVTLQGSLSMNDRLKESWESENVLNLYKDNQLMWKKIKKGEIEIDQQMFKIPAAVTVGYFTNRKPHDGVYTALWQHLSEDKEHITAMDFVGYSQLK